MTLSWLGVARLRGVWISALGIPLLCGCLSHTRSDAVPDAATVDAHLGLPDACACADSAPPVADAGTIHEVEAVLSSVTLADDCPVALDGDCADPGCDFCQQTSLQLQLTAPAEGDEVPFEVVSVSLFTEDGVFLEHLTAREPSVFEASGYVAWDERIAPSESLHVSYDATSPTWSVVDPERRFGLRYRVDVVVRIDGALRPLSLSPVMRQSEIDT